ncbi:hypothetical protein CKO44_01455 [Rubrivivax gelatinosus]|uniref:DUF3261 domain-containing protein n=1 Tax=Rubrivivax gelatinosus TaxID=28068 RepID=UPI00190864C3|nr:DUF3261 domain-containing protein [Rubrivivax gelatinosus]MBK1612135.1 hypothetical protein [Rubrivivax gelatinosus]MBZ8143530.1 hypothetical protein [Rubrivivax gelatinosus]
MRRLGAIVATAAVLAGCATAPAPAPLPEAPLLRLAPAALGRSLNQQQQISVSAPGRAPQRAELLLEVDAQAVRLAVFGLGQTAARLEWDGRQLRQQRAPWWPAAVSGERILSELQLALWPADAVRAALPAGWTLQVGADGRRLLWADRPVMTIRHEAPGRTELVNERDGYRLLIEAQDLEEARP